MLFPYVRDGYEDLLGRRWRGSVIKRIRFLSRALWCSEERGPGVSSVLAPVSFMSAYDSPVPPSGPGCVTCRCSATLCCAFFKQAKSTTRTKTTKVFREELGLPDRGSRYLKVSITDAHTALFPHCLRNHNRIGRRKRE